MACVSFHVLGYCEILSFSLPNLSNDIRWSIDLRWQRCDLPVAFHGLKEGVRFRSSVDPAHKIDWSPLETNDNVDASVNAMTMVCPLSAL